MGLVSPAWIVAGVLALAAAGYIAHCEHVKADREKFIASLRAQAEEQENEIKRKENEYRKAKEAADNEAKRKLDDLAHTVKRLRDERARASSVPAALANASRPDLICFARDEFARAVDNFEAGVEGIAAKGAEAAIGLESARSWSLKLSTELKPGGRAD